MFQQILKSEDTEFLLQQLRTHRPNALQIFDRICKYCGHCVGGKTHRGKIRSNQALADQTRVNYLLWKKFHAPAAYEKPVF
jgi:hypothetical protein